MLRRKAPVVNAEPSKAQVVLIADDDRSVVAQLQTFLTSLGYRCLQVADGTEVLTALRQHRPDLLLMDVEMPGLGGVEVCRIVKANNSFGFVPVILMTAGRAGAQTSGKIEGLELGADDYLIKPFDLMELSARVHSMLRLKLLQDTLVDQNRELDRMNRELELQRQQLTALSRTDGLTGLLNRRHFEERLDGEFARALRYHSPLSCLLLDIDHFKQINDTFGHQVGDQVIQGVSSVTKSILRDVDVLARYGGEELVALLPETSPEEAARAAERVRAGVEALSLSPRDQETQAVVKCTASVGVSTFPSPGVDSAHALVRKADQCLYHAKQSGRNRVSQSSPLVNTPKTGTP